MHDIHEEGSVPTSDGVRIFYRTSGEGEMTLLLMHGWGGSGSGSFWAPLMRHLDSQNVRIVLVDLRGHARSEHTREGFTTERFAKDMFEVADQIGARELIPVGYSMSGRWAQWMACACPERIVGQVLVGPAPASAMPLTPELADDWLRSVATRDGYHRFENQFTRNGLPQDILDDCFAAVQCTPEFSLRETLRMCAQAGFAEKLSLVKIPTVVIGGLHDPILTPDYVRQEVVAKIPGARFAVLDCGHNIPLEMPRETAAVVEGFLAGLAGRYPSRAL
ncbi:MAG TPA: alpha/beta hydrolase [Bryobacteraceae bacterium]|nr:alpha/beta hydrolase [Bryobacteraceae bacterium]